MSIRPASQSSSIYLNHFLPQNKWASLLCSPLKSFRFDTVIICFSLLSLVNAVSGQEEVTTTRDTLNKNFTDDTKYGKGGKKLIIINDNIYNRDSIVQYFDAKKDLREAHVTTVLKDLGVTHFTGLYEKFKGLDWSAYQKLESDERQEIEDFRATIGFDFVENNNMKDIDISQIQKIESDEYYDYYSSNNNDQESPLHKHPIKSSENIVIHDALGEQIFKEQKQYQSANDINKGIQKDEIIYLDSARKKHTKRFDSKTKKWQEYDSQNMQWKNISNTAPPENNQVSTEPPIDASNILFPKNEAFVGLAYMNIANSGQGNPGYGSFGVTGEYTRYITPHIGATLDFGAYFRKETQDDYTQSFTQFNVTAGASYIPINDPWNEDKKFTGNLHALGGISRIMVKESSGSYGLDNFSKNSFTFILGATLHYHISQRAQVSIQADYVHDSFFNTSQNNARFSMGPTFCFY